MRPVPPGTHDLTGHRIGRLVVIGLYAIPHPKIGGQWVCRCSCGGYQLQRRTAIVGRIPSNDGREVMCEKCNYLERVKWRYANMPPRDFKETAAPEVRKRVEPGVKDERARLFRKADGFCSLCGRKTRLVSPEAGIGLPKDAATVYQTETRNVRAEGTMPKAVLACYECNSERSRRENAGIDPVTHRARSMVAQLAVEKRVPAKPTQRITANKGAPVSSGLESIGSILAARSSVIIVEDRREESQRLMDCPLCGRSGLPDLKSFWQHVAARHTPDEIGGSGSVDSAMETALIRVVNSGSHDEAIEIATAALCGVNDDVAR